jgi:hypothetical protein
VQLTSTNSSIGLIYALKKIFISDINLLIKMNKKKNIKIKSYLRIIKQIEKVRSKNNKNWMDLYRLAFAVAPNESIKIIKKILKKDTEVTSLAKKLIK